MTVDTVEQENFDKLTVEIHQSRDDMESKLASTVAHLKNEVTTAQEKTSSGRWHNNLERRVTNISTMPSYCPGNNYHTDPVNPLKYGFTGI